MAPSRGKGKTNVYPLGKSAPARSTRRAARSSAQRGGDGVPEVYKDLLAEASANSSDDGGSDRPLKKRKLAGPTLSRKATNQNLQTVEDSSGSSDNSDESEFEFEDVQLDQPSSSPAGPKIDDDSIADVSIAIDSSKAPKRPQISKRKAATPAEKAFRLTVHKLDILCLLGHVMYVNSWCNDSIVQQHVIELLSEKTRSYLTHNPDFSQFQQNRSFMDGLQQASEAWRGAFQITASGMRRAKWNDAANEAPEAEMDALDREEFRRAAKELAGSQDVGNQLFCALLRAAGVETRLVCSLQVLPFGSGSKDKTTTPQKDAKRTVYATPSGIDSPATDSHNEDATMQNSSTVGKVPSARRRLGQPSFPSTPPRASNTPKRKRPIRKLTYPVFWVEAFNQAHQSWIPVDPLVTQTVGKASKLEPPGSYDLNQLNYVIAFENDGVARDVTKRYAKAYNAKTRRLRVESAESNGGTWLRKALRIFRRPRSDFKGRDRDQIEDSELAQREAQEGLPNNVQDFKHHPYYALERHLRRHEVIHPRREVGKFNAGTAARPRMEAVFRRGDVKACKSAEKWFRVGREVKKGQQPLKSVPARRMRKAKPASDDEDGEGEAISPLYALFQTELYVPPPVVNGKVPRNAYGNLDIYVPSMVPAGGAHNLHPLAKEAARILRIDAVDAVTGFKFQGRQGTAIVEGVIIAANFREAVEAAIDGLQDDWTEQKGMARSALALKMWKRFLTALRIKERVSAYGDGTSAVDEDNADIMEEDAPGTDAAGGFVAENTVEDEEVLPTAGKYSLADLLDAKRTPSARTKRARKESNEGEEAEFSAHQDTDEEQGGFEPDSGTRRTKRSRRAVVQDDSEDEYLPNVDGQLPHLDELVGDGEGGFLPDNGVDGGFALENEDGVGGGFISTGHDDIDEDGGGFMLDEETGESTHQMLDNDAQDLAPDQRIGRVPNELHQDVSMRDTSDTPALQSPTPVCDEENRLKVSADAASNERTDRPNLDSETLQSDSHHGTTDATQQPEWQVHGLAEVEQQPWPADADDESDSGSMLSHDPEDEDAEPDWLESD